MKSSTLLLIFLTVVNRADSYYDYDDDIKNGWVTRFENASWRDIPLDKKVAGLGVGPRLVQPNFNHPAGSEAYQGVLRLLFLYKKLLFRVAMDDDDLHADRIRWQYLYMPYSDRFPYNPCHGVSCPRGARCVLGACECTYNCPQGPVMADAAGTNCSQLPECLQCHADEDCNSMDVNLKCVREASSGADDDIPGTCQCGGITKWDAEGRQCRIHLDLDCSFIQDNETMSQELLNAIHMDNYLYKMSTFDLDRFDQSHYSTNIQPSILSYIRLEGLEEAVLTEAACWDVELFMAGVEQERAKSLPSDCARVPEGSCAILFDSPRSCFYSWTWPIEEGVYDMPFYFFNWRFRNAIGALEVNKGCNLTAYLNVHFRGHSRQFVAHTGTQVWELTDFFNNNIESLECFCDQDVVRDLFD